MNVTIIGGGVNGLFSAYYLQQAGHTVRLIERNHFADSCSHGNAGMIVPSHIIPLAQPGMIAKGMRWMLKSTSPFYVKPRLSRELMRWGYLFWQHSTEEHVERAIPVLRDLSLLSKKLYQDLAASGAVDFSWHERGLLMLYQTQDNEHEMGEEARIANRAGIDAQVLSCAGVQALEPDVSVTVRGAVYYPGDAHINPNKLIQELVAYLRKQGVAIVEGEDVIRFETQGKAIQQVITNKGAYKTDAVVVAAGAWSPELAKLLGLSLSLQGGKGYSFMQADLPANIRVPAIMLEARATATPIGNSLRFAGTLEVAGTDMRVNMNRVRGISEAINRYYPELTVKLPAAESVWRGLRPCSPDGIPYIGHVHRFENLVLATGHGMMGVSLGPATGKLVAEALSGQTTSLDLAPFNPERFS
nr:FAD-dependent oxidoreductase [uncultured Arsenicibacter sp.]